MGSMGPLKSMTTSGMVKKGSLCYGCGCDGVNLVAVATRMDLLAVMVVVNGC